LVFPPVAKRLGPLRSLRIASCLYPLVYFLTPYTSKIPAQTTVLRSICVVGLLAAKALCGIFAFPCSKILLCDSVEKGVLGSLNGISSSTSQPARAIGAVVVGKLFAVGLTKGVGVLPRWTLGLVSLGGLGTVMFLRDEID
jgi:hypothetical protein